MVNEQGGKRDGKIFPKEMVLNVLISRIEKQYKEGFETSSVLILIYDHMDEGGFDEVVPSLKAIADTKNKTDKIDSKTNPGKLIYGGVFVDD